MENFQIDNIIGTFSSCAIMTFCFLLYGCSSGQTWILCVSKTALWQIPVSSVYNPWPIPGRVLHKGIQPRRIFSVFSPYHLHTQCSSSAKVGESWSQWGGLHVAHWWGSLWGPRAPQWAWETNVQLPNRKCFFAENQSSPTPDWSR